MKHIKKFNETKKEDKVKDQEVLFNVEVLADKDEKPSFKTDIEDQEKVQKEFDKLKDKVEKFEAFIDIHIDNIENVEVEHEFGHDDSCVALLIKETYQEWLFGFVITTLHHLTSCLFHPFWYLRHQHSLQV